MASYFPMIKNSAQRIVFPILDADGDPVTGAASDTPDSEYSLNGGSFVNIADEIHEIATASGIYYLDLTADETNGDVVAIQVKTATAGTKTTVLVFYTSAQSLNTIDTNIDTLLTRLTAARAGYLNNLSAGAAALEATLTTMKKKAAGTYNRETDSLEALRNRGDAAWITGSGGGGDATLAKQNLLIQILTGKWEITNNQLIIYDTDGTTPLYTLNLTRDGDPTEFNPDKREPA